MAPLALVGTDFQQPRLESADAGLAKLQEIRECVDRIATDGAKFFDKGMRLALCFACGVGFFCFCV